MPAYLRAIRFAFLLLLAFAFVKPQTAQATVCPTTYYSNTDCAFIITIGPGGVISGAAVPNANPYDGSDDTLVGIVNNSGATFSGSITLRSTIDIFGFDGDGICAGYILDPTASAYCSAPYYRSDPGDYAGPLNTFSNISEDGTSGTVVVTGLAAGASTFFSLEGSPSQIGSAGGGTGGGLGGLPVGSPLSVSGNINLGTIPLGSPISAAIAFSGGMAPFSVSAIGTVPPGVIVSGGNISGTPTQPGNFTVTVGVTDSSGQSQSVAITFSVFGFTSLNLPPGVTGGPYYGMVSVAGGSPPYSFNITGLPKGLSANSSGAITGLIATPLTAQVKVTATEAGSGVSVTGNLNLVFAAPPPLTVPGATLPAGMVTTVYSQALNAMGGAPPYTFSLSSGTLPQGLSLRPTGTIAGIPSQSGTFSFGVRATDYTGASAVGAVSLAISPQPLTIVPSGALAGGVATFEYPGQTLGAVGGTGPYTFAVTTGSLPGGLSLSPGGMITGTPTSAGTSSFTVTATDSTGATAAAALSIVVRPVSTDLLLSTGSLNFALAAGSAVLPASQQVSVQSTSVSSPLGYSVAVSPATASWLSVTPTGGTTPSSFAVAVNSAASSLTASTTPYSATVTVTCLSPAPCAGSSQQVAVNLKVATVPPMLSISSTLISFSTPSSAPQPSSQTLTLQNTGGGSIGFASVSCADSWCSVTGTPGSLGPGGSANLTVNAGPAGLGAGFYRTTITITSSVGVYIVPVTLFIAGEPTLALEPAGALYQVSPGGTPNGSDSTFTVNASSSTPVTYTVAASSNATWIHLTSTSGTASATQPGSISFTFDPTVIAGLAPQARYATITVSAPGLVNSPQTFEVVLNELPATAPQRPAPTPAGLLFIASAATAPPAQNVSISTATASSIAFQVSASTMTGGSWLSATPSVGNAAPGAPGTAQVSVNPMNLQPGVYTGTVGFAFGTAGVRTVNVTLIVTPTATTAHDSAITSNAAGCTPSKLVPVAANLLGNFAAPVAWPTPLSVQLADDCGNMVTNGQIVATFSNGDPPVALSLSNAATGTYAGTWTPRSSSAQVTVNARASAPGLSTAVTQIAGSVTPNAAPVLAANSTLHLFNPQVGAALAPGNLVTISGSGLSVTSATAPAGAALPTILNGTQVVLGGTAVPLQSVSPTSLTAEVPFELMPGMQYQVLVNTNGALTTPDNIQLANTSPGVSTAAAGLLTAFHSNGNAVTEAAPAAPGESIYLLGAGLGATDIPVADGAISPSMPPANALDQPSVTINNEPATVSFAGLQPGAVGVYQVTFTVPMDAANGDLNLVLSQDGVPGNSAVLPVKKGSGAM